MNEREETGTEPPAATTTSAGRETRELFAFRASGRLLAVYNEEADGVAEGLSPAPLPHAPAAVLGVVSVRGRMRTLLDTRALFDAADAQTTPSEDDARAREDASAETPRFVVALRGDEQLALAADSIEGVINVNIDSLSASDSNESPPAAALEHEGRLIQILDTSRLFDAAMRGTERRRPRA